MALGRNVKPENNIDNSVPETLLRQYFQSVVSGLDVFSVGNFDVPQLHEEAWNRIEILTRDLSRQAGLQSKLQLIEGAAGTGKTHFLRALRSKLHAQKKGFFGYIQLSQAEDRYVFDYLAHLVSSLAYPYHPNQNGLAGLDVILDHYLELHSVADDEIKQLLSDLEIPADALAELIVVIADDILALEGLSRVEPDVVRALLYLRQPNPQVRNRILKFLQGAALTSRDNAYISAVSGVGHRPHRLFASLSMLVHGVDHGVLVFAVDQIDELIQQPGGEKKWCAAAAALIELWNETPNCLFLMSTLDGFYHAHRDGLLQGQRDRLEDERRIILPKKLSAAQVLPLIEPRHNAYKARLEEQESNESVREFPDWFSRELQGHTARKILRKARHWLEKGKLGRQSVILLAAPSQYETDQTSPHQPAQKLEKEDTESLALLPETTLPSQESEEKAGAKFDLPPLPSFEELVGQDKITGSEAEKQGNAPTMPTLEEAPFGPVEDLIELGISRGSANDLEEKTRKSDEPQLDQPGKLPETSNLEAARQESPDQTKSFDPDDIDAKLQGILSAGSIKSIDNAEEAQNFTEDFSQDSALLNTVPGIKKTEATKLQPTETDTPNPALAPAKKIQIDLKDLPDTPGSRYLSLLGYCMSLLPRCTLRTSNQLGLRRSPSLNFSFAHAVAGEPRLMKLYWADRPAENQFLHKQITRYFRLSGSQKVVICHCTDAGPQSDAETRLIADAREYCFTQKGLFFETSLPEWQKLEEQLRDIEDLGTFPTEKLLSMEPIGRFYRLLNRSQ